MEESVLQDLISRVKRQADVFNAELILQRMRDFAQILGDAGVPRCWIYGSGAVGRSLHRAVSECSIKVEGFVDSEEERSGSLVQGLRVHSVEEAVSSSLATWCIGSFASASQMLERLNSAYRLTRRSYQAFVPPGPAPPCMGMEDVLHLPEQWLKGISSGRNLADTCWLMENALERMDPWVPVFNESRRLYHLARYRFAGQLVKDCRVLDCACGTGYGSSLLHTECNAREVLGVDSELRAVDYARHYFGSPEVEFEVLDAAAVRELGRRFDAIVSIETIEHVPDDRAVLQAFANMLTDSGLCVISTPDDCPADASPHHVRSYDRRTFRSTLEEYFGEVKLFAQWSTDRRETAGIEPVTARTPDPAECLIAVCRRPRTSN